LADFVLVHGAWGGGFSYDRLAAELTGRGHRVLVAQLAGLGTRAAGLNPAIDLKTHINDVLGQIGASGFDRFILCGHSYGGMVITGVAAQLGARIDAILYIDAFLPEDNQSLWDITGAWEHERYIACQRDMPGLVSVIFGGPPNPRLGRHPLLTLLEPVHFTGEEAKVRRHGYVLATGYAPSPFVRFADKVRSDPAWEFHEVGGGHDVMADQPEVLLEIVLGLAG
jgi:pimeloyl-ACP methyl ester carboxylesterase